MMNIRDLFAKPVDRTMEGVIKADDESQLQVELEEYVITNEVARNLTRFLDAYNNYQGANGVWISGFFGSGKSHLLKMLALLLGNRTVNEAPALDYFRPKLADDAMLKGALEKAVSLPSTCILFNIDQKADTIETTQTDKLLAVFLKVFNETCGYFGKQGYIAKFERDLDKEELLEAFRNAFFETTGKTWKEGRERVVLYKAKVDEAYQQVTGQPTPGIIDHYRSTYRVSIEDFAELLRDHIEGQPDGCRIIFLVDEVGQFIADDIKLMTNLQTIAESLATRCRGRAWVIVTAQEDMERLLGEMGKKKGADFSKIQDRFRTRMKLTSANVDAVIEERLLKKKDRLPLVRLYDQHSAGFGTLFEFAGGTRYRLFRDQDDFVHKYPFIPYQFTLFQAAITGISEHAGFEGRHSSVGERSMLGVFQEVVKRVADQPVGQLAAFDQMFEGVRAVLKTKTQMTIRMAEQNLEDPFAERVLKALFLVKYVKGFHATPRNLRVLLQTSFDQDLQELEAHIGAALTTLEAQTYVQRIGEVYSFLTDEEKDIEREIKSTDVDERDVLALLEDLFFNGLIKNRKIRFDKTGQDFPFTKMIDGQISGRSHELTVHLVTPFHEHAGNLPVLQANAMGKAELTIVLPTDDRLMRDATLYRQTDKYLRQQTSRDAGDAVRRVLADKRMQNQNRQKELRSRLETLVGEASVLVSGNLLEDLPGREPRSRVLRGFEILVESAYHNLKMLYKVAYSETQIDGILNAAPGMFDDEAALNEAAREVLAHIQGRTNAGQSSTIKTVLEHFERKPYGWYLAAVQCILARLCRLGKVEARADSNLLEGRALAEALRNTRRHANVILRPQQAVSPGELKRARTFFQDFFDRPPTRSDARQLGEEFKTNLNALVEELEQLHQQTHTFPFLNALAQPLAALRSAQGKHYSYYLRELPAQGDALLVLKDSTIHPIRQFMAGEQRAIFSQARDFVREQTENFDALGRQAVLHSLQILLEDPECFKGGRMTQIKRQLSSLRSDITKAVKDERLRLLKELGSRQKAVEKLPDYAALDKAQRDEVAARFARTAQDIERQTLLGLMRERLRRFEAEEYIPLLNEMAAWAQPDPQPGSGEAAPRKVADAPAYLRLDDVLAELDKAPLESAADVEAYLAGLRGKLLQAVQEGKRILP